LATTLFNVRAALDHVVYGHASTQKKLTAKQESPQVPHPEQSGLLVRPGSDFD
jgi:hypothetical protein